MLDHYKTNELRKDRPKGSPINAREARQENTRHIHHYNHSYTMSNPSPHPRTKAPKLVTGRVRYQHFLQGTLCVSSPIIELKQNGRWLPYAENNSIMKFKSVEDAENHLKSVLASLTPDKAEGKAP